MPRTSSVDSDRELNSNSSFELPPSSVSSSIFLTAFRKEERVVSEDFVNRL